MMEKEEIRQMRSELIDMLANIQCELDSLLASKLPDDDDHSAASTRARLERAKASVDRAARIQREARLSAGR